MSEKARATKVGPGRDADSEMGPVITAAARDRIVGLIGTGAEQGADLAVDGRGLTVAGHENGFFVGPTVIDRVTTEMDVYREEIFGPVLSVVRMDTVDDAIKLINSNPYGNGTAIFTGSGEAARTFQRGVKVGMIGINVPVPVPMAYYSFGGWKDSLFGQSHIHGPEGVQFYTRAKVVTQRWPHVEAASRLLLPLPHVDMIENLTLGTAPDSWGVWFARDDHQVGWKQYLDEIGQAGYRYTELGPTGFLPQDPEQLRDELDSRGLTLCGGTIFAGLHRGAEALDDAVAACAKEARLLTALGAKHLVLLPEQYTDMHGGKLLESPEAAGAIDPDQWRNLTTGYNQLGKILTEEHGVELVFHPHADTHVDTQARVERFLLDTDPAYVNLCLDTGHISYCDGDNIAIVQRFPERIRYVHLKQVDPEVRRRVHEENLSLAEAVPLGVMCEPPYGVPEMPPLLDALAALPVDLFTVVEQDLYPVEPHIPLPIAARTAGYLRGCGLGPVRRWPYRS